jgi:hypothetical protein
MLKLSIQLHAKEFSKNHDKQRRSSISKLENDLLEVNEALASQPTDEDLLSRRARLDLMLANYYADIHEAARLKAGMKYASLGERPTKYFTSIVKQRSEKNALTSLTVTRDNTKVVLESIEEILEEASDFYAKLYRRKIDNDNVLSNECETFLKSNVDKTLTEDFRSLCDQPVSLAELNHALRKLPKGKVPGIDGLPAELFRYFWTDLKESFMDVVQNSFNSGDLPDTMRTSIITLIYKKKDRDDLRNYRPISLLCSDYKIIAKVLAERMKLVLPFIIQKDQTGFLKDRYIGENISLFLDTQHYLHKTKKTGYAFLAHWENDRIDRPFLEKSLQAFGFGPNFIKWFNLLHKDSNAQVILNGFLTESFNVQSGVRQGCPWAPFLFLVGIEPLACALRNNSTVNGIDLPDGKKILYSGYADDTTLFLSSLEDLHKCVSNFNIYSKYSGMKLNLSKSTVIPLGAALAHDPPHNFPFKYLLANEDETLLGVSVSRIHDPIIQLGIL